MTAGKNIERACQTYFLALTIPIEIGKKDEGQKREDKKEL